MSRSSSQSWAGRTIGRYELVDELGRGGMGVVYRAHDPHTDRLVALKVLRTRSPHAAQRFQREAEALARVRHPNVVAVHEYHVTAQGEPYMVMELIQGQSLQDRLDRGGPLDVEEALRATETLCGAIAACHQAGVLHRDLKPDNVLVDREGTLKLTDFGLVRDVDPSTARTQLTQEGRMLGTPGYWSPEQATGDLSRIGPHTDVYGLGATLFALLTAQAPVEATQVANLLGAVFAEKPAPSSLNPAVPAWVDAVVADALAVRIEDRYPSAEALREALTRPAGAGLGARGLALGLLGVVLALGVGVLAARSSPATVASASPTPSASPSTPAPATPAPNPELARWLEQAQVGIEQGAYVEAQALVERVLDARPDDVGGLTLRGMIHMFRQRPDDALRDLSRAIELDPDGAARAYYARGCLYAQRKEYETALADFDRVLAVDSSLAELHLQRGEVLGGLERHTEAVEAFQAALERDPSLAAAHVNLAVSQRALGHLAEALAAFTAAIEADPELPRAWLGRGALRGVVEDYEQALGDLDRALELSPGNVEALYNRGLVQLGLERPAQALADLQGALEREPRFVPAYFQLGLLYLRGARPALAARAFSDGIRYRPDSAELFAHRGTAMLGMGRLDQALADYQHALELDPEYAYARHYLAQLQGELDRQARGEPTAMSLERRGIELAEAGELSGALEALDQAIALAPSATGLFSRGVVRGRLGDLEGEIDDDTRALELAPLMVEAFHNRGYALARFGDWAGAIEDYERALALDPTFFEGYMNRGIARRRLGRLREALADYESALQLGGHRPEAAELRAAIAELRAELEQRR